MAGFIDPATLEQIRGASDVVDVIGSYLPLKRAGANFVTLCPFHKEKSPSFNVNPHRQIFHCFGCHKGGDVFTFVKEYENIGFVDAMRRLAERAARLEAIAPARPVQKGDFIIGTLSCRFVKGKGKNLKDEPLLLEAGSEENHPDFNAAILGMEAGTTRTFEVDYPADYNAVSLRNSTVEYTLVLGETKKKVVPPLDDSLAKEIGAFASIEEMRAKVRSEIERRATHAERDEADAREDADAGHRDELAAEPLAQRRRRRGDTHSHVPCTPPACVHPSRLCQRARESGSARSCRAWTPSSS